MGCGLDHLTFEKKNLEFRCPLQRQRFFLTFLEKSLKTGMTCSSFYIFLIQELYGRDFFLRKYWGFFSIKILMDKKLLKLLFADARYIWSVFLACRTICPDTIKNKCLANDVITEEFSLLFIAVGTLRRNTRPRTTFHEKEFSKKKKKSSLRRPPKINHTCG